MYQSLSSVSTLTQIVNAINAILRGRSNAVGTITLDPLAASTVIEDPRISADSSIHLQPTNGITAACCTSTYISSIGNGTATITHLSTGDLDKTYKYTIHG